MPISKLTFARYRAFRDPQTVTLGRLTLLYGRNSSGKSAVLRLPKLLADSMGGSPGLNLGSKSIFESTFQDLRWRSGRDGELLTLGLELDGQESWEWELDWREQRGEGVLKAVRRIAESGARTLRWSPVDRNERGPQRTFKDDGGDVFQVTLRGLKVESAALDSTSLSGVASGALWLTTNRVGPNRFGVARGLRPEPDARGGTWAEAELLQDDRSSELVSNWYRDNTGAEVVSEDLDNRRRLRLRHLTESSPDLPFPDVGEGLQQTFSVLVALEKIRREGGLLCVEEPEAHLHPALQRALAQRIVEVLATQPAAQVLLETHSQVFLYEALLRALRELRDGVRLHWVEQQDDGASVVRPIPLDDQARPEDDTLLRGFHEMAELRRELLNERRRHAG